MLLKVKYFARFSELTGKREENIEIGNESCILDLKKRILVEHPLLKSYESTMVVAKNETFAAETDKLNSGDMVYLFPPVSGG